MKMRIALGLLPLIIAGCSGSSGGGGGAPAAAPLTAAQTEQLDITAQNLSYISDWDTSTAAAKPALASISNQKAAATKAKADIQNRIFDPSSCVIDVVQSKPPAQSTDPSKPMVTTTEGGASIAGAVCPIVFSWSNKTVQIMDLTAKTLSVNADFSFYYRGQSTQAEKLDIALYQVKSKSAFSGDNSGMTGTSSGSGEILSRSQGKISISLNGNTQAVGQSLVSTDVASISYPDGLVVDLKNVTTWTESQQPTQAYFINGAPVTEKVFKNYRKSFGLEKANGDQPESKMSRG